MVFIRLIGLVFLRGFFSFFIIAVHYTLLGKVFIIFF